MNTEFEAASSDGDMDIRTGTDRVRVTIHSNVVAWLELQSPDKLNAINLEMYHCTDGKFAPKRRPDAQVTSMPTTTA